MGCGQQWHEAPILLDYSSAFKGATEGDFIGIFEVAANWQTRGHTDDMQDAWDDCIRAARRLLDSLRPDLLEVRDADA